MKLRLLNPFQSRPSLVRTPLPGFDPIYYLFWYPDVRAARLDPLHHYLHHGWKEGRDPSAGFSTSGYLAANPDVVKAEQNPLLHFINAGLAEGRKGFDKDPESPAPRPIYDQKPLKLLAPPETVNPRSQQGYLDTVDHTHIWGWAVASGPTDRTAKVEIIINGTLIGSVIADVFRSDLRDHEIGNAHHGFAFFFDPPLDKNISHSVVVRRSVDQFEIGRAVL